MENKTVAFGFGSSTGLSFADLASSNSGDFAFGSKGKIRRRGFNDRTRESSKTGRTSPLPQCRSSVGCFFPHPHPPVLVFK